MTSYHVLGNPPANRQLRAFARLRSSEPSVIITEGGLSGKAQSRSRAYYAAMQTAQTALEQLLAGNERFAAGRPTSHPSIERVRELAGGQSPFATVLACADSRVPVETLFDHEPGDIFVVRLAGNFVSDAALASIEYAVAVLKSPLVMVLGHTACGAVKAAMDYLETGQPFPGHMQIFATAIEPAVRACRGQDGDWWRNAVAENVRLNTERLRTTPILREAVVKNQAAIAGAVYDLSTGRVTLI